MYFDQSWQLGVRYRYDVLLFLLLLGVFSITVYLGLYRIIDCIPECNHRYESSLGLTWRPVVFLAGGLFIADRLTDTDTLPYFHLLSTKFHQLSSKPHEKLASNDAALSFLLLLVVIFIPELRGNKHQPPVFFCPHPSFSLLPTFPRVTPPSTQPQNTSHPPTHPIGCLSILQLPRIRQADVGAPWGRPWTGEVVLLQPLSTHSSEFIHLAMFI